MVRLFLSIATLIVAMGVSSCGPSATRFVVKNKFTEIPVVVGKVKETEEDAPSTMMVGKIPVTTGGGTYDVHRLAVAFKEEFASHPTGWDVSKNVRVLDVSASEWFASPSNGSPYPDAEGYILQTQMQRYDKTENRYKDSGPSGMELVDKATWDRYDEGKVVDWGF